MNEILGIEVPEDINTLSDEDLTSFVENLRVAAKSAVEAGGVDVVKLEEIKSAKAQIDAGKTVLTERKRIEDELACECGKLLDELSEQDPGAEEDEPVEPEEGEEKEKVVETTTKVPTAAVSIVGNNANGGNTGTATEAVTWSPRTRSAAAISEKAPETAVTPMSPTRVPMKAAAGVNGYSAGDEFESMTDLSQALLTRWDDIAGGGSEKLSVANIKGRFPEEVYLTEDIQQNLIKLGGLDLDTVESMNAITAAMCAPAEPYYGLACMSSTMRPVRGSFSTYVPARGAVTIYPSPKLADITGGTGLWTRADDANASATKAACATIPCATPVQYDIYGLYRCMTVKNLLQMTFPELVEAFLNRLAAIQARLGEVTLLDAMLGSVNLKNVTVAAPSPNIGASINLLATLIRVLAVYREEERYADQDLDMWAPRWMREALRVDLVRQRVTSGVTMASRVPTGADVDAALRNVGVNVTWTMDNATSWTGVAAQTDGGALPAFPTTAKFILAPRGNFRLMDRGELSIGVTNNGIYRDNVSNSKNQFTIFLESFEGLMDFGCTSYEVTMSGFSPNGQQIGDIAAA